MARFILSILLGAVAAFGLFVIMAKLIENTGRPPEPSQPTPVIDIVMKDPDEDPNTRQRTPPPPPPPPQQPPKIEPVPPEAADADTDGMNFQMPSVDVGGSSIAIGGIGALARDGDATPIVRIDPKYPVQAARDGKEGWVKLSFTINELGGVEDVTVIDAEPKRIFDREARRALKKWKYKPKVVDGKAQRQPGLTVQLDFKLDQG